MTLNLIFLRPPSLKSFLHTFNSENSVIDESRVESSPGTQPTKEPFLNILVLASLFLILIPALTFFLKKPDEKAVKVGTWSLQSVDTVKYSRDAARDKAQDDSFDKTIGEQVAAISGLGTTHIAIGTPYDPEFVPYLRRWVAVARKHNLKIWFRGNLSGWEGWFGYKYITMEEHKKGIENFILQNHDIFSDGDIFTPCTECENGNLGDPRQTGDVAGFRNFLIEEYKLSKQTFSKIGKIVNSGYFSMNADVARLVMDRQTTQALGGVVVIDHYVETPKKLELDIKEIAQLSGGKVVLGEFGVPIPDIHGNLTEEEQALWLDEAMARISGIEDLVGVNYWTSFGGSTQIWEEGGRMRKIGDVIRKYYFYLDSPRG